MRRKLSVLLFIIVLLVVLLKASAYADTATFHVANAPQEDTYSCTGASNANVYNQAQGLQYFGYYAQSRLQYDAFWRWAIDIPKGSTITAAHVLLRADNTSSGAVNMAFSALAPDGHWDNANGFGTTNYSRGTDLINIPRYGTPVPWDNIPNWTSGVVYTGPDISQLVQARIDSGAYDPLDDRGKYFGLSLSYVSGSYYRVATQEPDDDTFTAQLCVEWTPGPPPPPPADVSAVFYIGQAAEEDTFAATGALNQNGYNNTSGWQYFGYASTTASWYSSYWRWGLSIPRGATITSAFVQIRSDYSNLGYLDAAFQALTPDGKWDGANGFGSLNYPNGASLNAIPKQGMSVPWNNVPGWTSGTWFYSPELASLVQERIDNPDYDPNSAQGRYFGLALYHVSGNAYRTGTQEPDIDSYTAQLHVRWLDPCPTADAGEDQTVFVGAVAILDGSASSDLNGDMLTYNWSITARPQASVAELSDPTALMPEIMIDRPGEYVFELTVSDGMCESVPDQVILTTINSCPVADAGPDQSAFVGDTVFLDGAASRDVDFDALSYSWTLASKPAESAASITPANGVVASFIVDKPGEYLAELSVNDGTCESSPDSAIVSTVNVPPVAEAGNDQEIPVGQSAPLNGTQSYDPDGDTLSFFWSILNAPAQMSMMLAGPVLSDPTSPTPLLSAAQEGQYVVQLVVSDGATQSEPDNCLITAIVPEYRCPLGQGFWANHSEAWPVASMTLGNYQYDKAALLGLLKTPPKGDASIILARQLIAAELNIENEADPSSVNEAVCEAQDLLSQCSRMLPCGIKPSSTLGAQMVAAASVLEQFNEGRLTDDCTD